MNEPRIVTPQEARERVLTLRHFAGVTGNLTVLTDEQEALLHTVASEPDRIRAAVRNAVTSTVREMHKRLAPGAPINEEWVACWVDTIIEDGALL